MPTVMNVQAGALAILRVFVDHEAFVPAEHLSNEIIFADCLFSVAAALPMRMPAYSNMRADLCDEQDNIKLDALCVVLAQASI